MSGPINPGGQKSLQQQLQWFLEHRGQRVWLGIAAPEHKNVHGHSFWVIIDVLQGRDTLWYVKLHKYETSKLFPDDPIPTDFVTHVLVDWIRHGSDDREPDADYLQKWDEGLTPPPEMPGQVSSADFS